MEQETLMVMKPGTHVIVHDEIKGVVVAVQLESNRVTYKVQYRDGMDIKEVWGDEFTVKILYTDQQLMKIGF